MAQVLKATSQAKFEDELYRAFCALGVGRDGIPHSEQMKRLTRNMRYLPGCESVTEAFVWSVLYRVDRVKRKGGKRDASIDHGDPPDGQQLDLCIEFYNALDELSDELAYSDKFLRLVDVLNEANPRQRQTPGGIWRWMRNRQKAAIKREGADNFPLLDHLFADKDYVKTYFIGAFDPFNDGSLRSIKIGKSRVPDRRLNDLNNCVDELRFLAVLPGDHEVEYQRRFERHKIRPSRVCKDEWYRPDPEILEFIEANKERSVA